MSAYIDDQCPARGPALTHTLNGVEGSRCVECGTKVYIRDEPRRVVEPSPERIAQWQWEEWHAERVRDPNDPSDEGPA